MTRDLINFEATPEIREKLAYLCKKAERNMSQQIRWLINREWNRQFQVDVVEVELPVGTIQETIINQ